MLTERGTQGFEKGELLIRAIPTEKKALGRGGPSFWRVRSEKQIDLIWNDGFTGVDLLLTQVGKELRGKAHPHFDSSIWIPRVA
jgi:hypothetical protein